MNPDAREAGPQTLPCVGPGSGRPIASLPVCGPEDVQAAVTRARAAQVEWAARPIRERAQVILALRDRVLEQENELAQLLSMECGKPEIEAYMAEILTFLDLATYYARRAERMLAPQPIGLHLLIHRRSYLHYTPRGVIGVISPWNFPFIIPMGDVVVALLAGNGVVVKPSEQTPLIALKARDLALDAGVPADLFQVVTGYGATGAALTDCVDKVVFTGSVATGRRVAVACAERLIPCALELGGKAPAIVLPGADLDRAANALVWGAFVNSGQVCVSVERVYVHTDLHDAFVEKVVRRAERLRQGDPRQGTVDVGAIIHPLQLDRAREQVEQAVQAGATVRVGGSQVESEGDFFQPTVLTGVPQDALVMQQETFGPLMPIRGYDTVDEAVQLANDSHLG
ncbi:MAG: aldehyde dehydrogenase family protein, partial [Myxococcota bacterium]|nr:aldehyde dehydrogenase family protein [Myxococcota bacterium]